MSFESFVKTLPFARGDGTPSQAIARLIDTRLPACIDAGAGLLHVVQRAIRLPAREGDAILDAPPDGRGLALRLDRSIRRESQLGLRMLGVGLCFSFGLGGVMPISSAVVTPGSLVSRSSVKKIQHPTGGIVASIDVQDGMRVQQGDLLMRLDGTQPTANLLVVATQLDQVRARIARLNAETSGLARMPPPVPSGVADADRAIDGLAASETALFRTRATSRQSQRDAVTSHVTQLSRQIAGLEAQLTSRAREIELIASELGGVQTLFDKKLVPLTRLAALQREAARLDGEKGQLQSSVAEIQSKISEADLQLAKADNDFQMEVSKDLREAQDKEAELMQRLVVARDLVLHTSVRAPASGYVHQLTAHTIGGVVTPGDVVMEIVPDRDELVIEARVKPKDIDHVLRGQHARVRLSAFSQNTTPELEGEISYVSSDVSQDKQNTTPEYVVRVTLPESELHRLGALQLVPGMPAEVFLQTGSRTMLGMIVKPIADQLHRTFNDL